MAEQKVYMNLLLIPAFFLLIALATCYYSINRISWCYYVYNNREKAGSSGKQPEQN